MATDKSSSQAPAIWSAVLAAIAIALTQLPPIKEWFPKNNIAITGSAFCVLTEYAGYPGLGIDLNLSNRGNREQEIGRVEASFQLPNQARQLLPTAVYMDPPQQFSASAIRLKASESFKKQFIFLPLLTPSEEEEFGKIQTDVMERSSRGYVNNTDAMNAYSESEKESREYLARRPKLAEGEYHAEIVAYDNNGKQVGNLAFKFNVLPYHISSLARSSVVRMSMSQQQQVFTPMNSVTVRVIR